MKFGKKYEEFMQGQDQKKKQLPGVGFKNLKKIIKRCRKDDAAVVRSHHNPPHPPAVQEEDEQGLIPSSTCPGDHCPVCDGTFFPSLLKEMSAVVGTFNERAQQLLDVHLASGFRKCFIWCKDKVHGNNKGTLMQEGKELVGYAIIHAIAMRKILKKYDKIHYSKQGHAFRSQVQSMHMEILQSPWLFELIAFHINLRETKPGIKTPSALFEGCSLVLDDGKPTLFCELSDSFTIDIDLTCSICLDTVFDPVSLTCGHIFCYLCACKAGSVNIVDGIKAAHAKEKCPLCREAGVYEGAVHLEELNVLLSRRCPKYWEERLRSERAERVRQTKEHWESLSRSFVGV